MIAGVILAAGAACRMEKIKQLLPLGPQPMLWHVAQAACRSRLDEVILISGASSEPIAAAVSGLPLRVIHNPDWQQGQSSSLKAGLLSLQPNTEAVMFLLADQPLVTPELIDALIGEWRSSGKTIVCPCYEANRGNPVLLDLAAWRTDLEQLGGDQGARRILAAHPEAIGYLPVATDEIFLDVDTAEDYARMQQRFRMGGK